MYTDVQLIRVREEESAHVVCVCMCVREGERDRLIRVCLRGREYG